MGTYSYLEIHHLLGESAHLIVEAKSVLARVFCRKDKVTLAFLYPIHDDSFIWTNNNIINVEGAPGLYLDIKISDAVERF